MNLSMTINMNLLDSFRGNPGKIQTHHGRDIESSGTTSREIVP